MIVMDQQSKYAGLIVTRGFHLASPSRSCATNDLACDIFVNRLESDGTEDVKDASGF